VQENQEPLGEMNVEFYYADVDLLPGAEKTEAMDTIKKWIPVVLFPLSLSMTASALSGMMKPRSKKY